MPTRPLDPHARKLAFQDGVRSAIETLDLLARQALGEGRHETYKVLDEAALRLRGELDHDVAPGPLDYEARLWCVGETFKAIVDHARDGGSFRHLIYGRLGFDLDAYVPLYEAGGMTISNEFVIAEPDASDTALAEALSNQLWPKAGDAPIAMKAGEEPWLTVCRAVERIKLLSAALSREQEIRARGG